MENRFSFYLRSENVLKACPESHQVRPESLEPFKPSYASSKVKNEKDAQKGLATAFDLAAFRLSMIAPVKKSVNHSRTIASMRETGEQEQK